MEPAVNVEIVPELTVIVPVEIALVAMEPMEAVASVIDPVDKLFTFSAPTFNEAVEIEFVLIVDTFPNPKEAIPDEIVLAWSVPVIVVPVEIERVLIPDPVKVVKEIVFV
jgi:hypothetical protein